MRISDWSSDVCSSDLTRHGAEVVIVRGAGCCGALQHHLGKTGPSHRFARANIAAWTREIDGDGLDAIVINASGCGTQVKDYGFMFREDAARSEEHTSELQSLMRISYAVFCLKKKKNMHKIQHNRNNQY